MTARHDDSSGAREVHSALSQNRLTMTPLEQEAEHEWLWEQVRMLAYHAFSGGEVAEEWGPLFERLQRAEFRAANAYLLDAWGFSSGEGASSWHAFRLKIMEGHVHAMRAAGFSPLPPAGGEPDVLRWEEEFGFGIPEHLKWFFVNISTGHNEPDETWLFNLLPPEEEEYRLLMPFASFEDLFGEDIEVFRDVLARSLSHFGSGGKDTGEFLLPEALEAFGEGRDWDAVEGLVPLSLYFEGNHGDENVYLITSGPLTGRMIGWRDMFHSEPGGGTLVFSYEHFADWVWSVYLDEIWAGSL